MTSPAVNTTLPSPFGFVPDPHSTAGVVQQIPEIHEDPLLTSNRYYKRLFHSNILPDDRAVTIYLPESYYHQPDQRYPVFYLHDGQNLFDGRTSYIPGCTWQAHSTADALTREGLVRPLILVGVANTGLRRVAEYTPTRDYKMGGGEGQRYGQLLAEELKPLVDQRYRTLAGPQDTGLGGSSLGGLISLAIGLERPDIFANLAVMSPSLWWDHRKILNQVARLTRKPELRIWLDMGTEEGSRHIRDSDLLYKGLQDRGWKPGADLMYTRVEGGLHNEQAWARRFGNVLRFLFPAYIVYEPLRD